MACRLRRMRGAHADGAPWLRPFMHRQGSDDMTSGELKATRRTLNTEPGWLSKTRNRGQEKSRYHIMTMTPGL